MDFLLAELVRTPPPPPPSKGETIKSACGSAGAAVQALPRLGGALAHRFWGAAVMGGEACVAPAG